MKERGAWHTMQSAVQISDYSGNLVSLLRESIVYSKKTTDNIDVIDFSDFGFLLGLSLNFDL